MDNNIKVTIWGKEVGRLTWDASRKRSIFEYASSFLKGGLDIAPLTASIHDRRSRLPFMGKPTMACFMVFQPSSATAFPENGEIQCSQPGPPQTILTKTD